MSTLSTKESLKVPQEFNPREDARFLPLCAKIESHWEEFRPKTFANLQKRGDLKQIVEKVAENTVSTLHLLQEQGMSPDQAKEFANMLWNQPEKPE